MDWTRRVYEWQVAPWRSHLRDREIARTFQNNQVEVTSPPMRPAGGRLPRASPRAAFTHVSRRSCTRPTGEGFCSRGFVTYGFRDSHGGCVSITNNGEISPRPCAIHLCYLDRGRIVAHVFSRLGRPRVGRLPPPLPSAPTRDHRSAVANTVAIRTNRRFPHDTIVTSSSVGDQMPTMYP